MLIVYPCKAKGVILVKQVHDVEVWLLERCG